MNSKQDEKQLTVADDAFIRHIQSHLKEGEKVVCKICGLSAEEISKIPVTVPKNELVELDDDKLIMLLFEKERIQHMSIEFEKARVIAECIELARNICSKFGVPRKPSKEQMELAIKEAFGEFASDLPTRHAAELILRLIGGEK